MIEGIFDSMRLYMITISFSLSLQGFQMCLMDYEFHVLDNAFLIHRPGIKTKEQNPTKPNQKLVNEQNKFIKNVIQPELTQKVGNNKDCYLR